MYLIYRMMIISLQMDNSLFDIYIYIYIYIYIMYFIFVNLL